MDRISSNGEKMVLLSQQSKVMLRTSASGPMNFEKNPKKSKSVRCIAEPSSSTIARAFFKNSSLLIAKDLKLRLRLATSVQERNGERGRWLCLSLAELYHGTLLRAD